jgi:anti-sigma regulatory factor (Ser/Thr protein kinase)
MPVIPLPSASARPEPTAAPPSIPTVPAHWTLPAIPTSVGRARWAVADALPPGIDVHLADDIALLTSELVTNAVRYGTRHDEEELIEVILWPADGHYWLAVSDPGDGHPAVRASGPHACRGRGLFLVDAISAAWGVVSRRTCGKSVVAGVTLHGV